MHSVHKVMEKEKEEEEEEEEKKKKKKKKNNNNNNDIAMWPLPARYDVITFLTQ